jgi:FKBP12-rapamycin complex-associated protein
MINSAFIEFKFSENQDYKKIVESLKNCGDLEEIGIEKDGNHDDYHDYHGSLNNTTMYRPYNSMSMIDSRMSVVSDHHGISKNTALLRTNLGQGIMSIFEVEKENFKDDLEVWHKKLLGDVIQNSPSLILKELGQYPAENPRIAAKLFNGAFAIIWGSMNDKQKGSVIKNLEGMIGNEKTPNAVKQTILELAEFMEHDTQGLQLQLDISLMANLAEKCNAHAKSLYYRETEFEFAPESTIESLISLYSNLEQPEAARGMLEVAKRKLKVNIETEWLEKLLSWQDAKNSY